MLHMIERLFVPDCPLLISFVSFVDGFYDLFFYLGRFYVLSNRTNDLNDCISTLIA